MIERTIYAASTDETRYNLNGVYFQVLEDNGKLRMVATDGHRLAMVDRLVSEGGRGLASGVILPRKALGELKRLVDEEESDEIEVGFEGTHALARSGDVTLVMRLIDGEFPNYNQVLPKAPSRKLTLSAETFAQVIRRISLLSAERSRAIRVELADGKMTVSSSNPDLGEATEEVDIDYRGETLNIGFNARYLLDALSAFHTKEVEMSFDDELSPVVLRPTSDAESTAVVMPMRL
jgi:DNA polymerase-3 subunit beta